MRNLIVLTVGALLLASCNGGGTVTPPTEQPNPPIETPPPSNPNPPTNPTTPDKPLYIPGAGAAVGSGDGTKEGTIYISPSADEVQLMNLINEVRTKGTVGGTDAISDSCVAGKYVPLKALTYNGLYSFAARKHADYITNIANEAHYENQTNSTFFYGRTVNERVVRTYKELAGLNKYYIGENVTSYGGELTSPARQTVLEAVRSWMHSSGHCAAIMDPDIYDFGAGRSYRENTSDQDNRVQNAWVLIVGNK
ncbi:CAP domain-containing protein [Deinococcus gobiensis]|uniref:SCP domain-containing protein n=1 Tax=Deinococcus gobiensis (strain DSM 21396 / JCM 16679 / CGMCC 1.7299 / I-0) TaxID=745776 RepID=H8H1R0_DEIGI|nr:CAP domain-containing protein [Deinococcus gobiensis]AFD27457.1 hypothetical protein DGo_PB0188 [Deinococcus gobiensis I-0]